MIFSFHIDNNIEYMFHKALRYARLERDRAYFATKRFAFAVDRDSKKDRRRLVRIQPDRPWEEDAMVPGQWSSLTQPFGTTTLPDVTLSRPGNMRSGAASIMNSVRNSEFRRWTTSPRPCEG